MIEYPIELVASRVLMCSNWEIVVRSTTLPNPGTAARIWIGLILAVLSADAHAAMSRPAEEKDRATEVRVVGAILDVDKIDSAEQSFTLNFYAIFRWMDTRLTHDGPGSVIRKLSEVWNPRLTLVNTQRYWSNTGDEVEVSPDGQVTYRLHVFGNFSQPMDLRAFPLDRHVFELPVVAAGYRPHEVALVSEPQIDSFMAEKLSVADWDMSNLQGKPRQVRLANGLELPGYVFSFEGRRLLHHYVVKAIVPLGLIVMMSWVVFWIRPDQVPNQLSVAVTTVLTLIAYHIALSGRLPDIPYLTHMDKFLFGSTVLVFMALIEVVSTSHLASTDRLAQARRIDIIARWLFPLMFLAVVGYSFFV